MATIKSYTDLSQSKKLAEILPIESADMYYNWYIEEDGDPIESGHRITTPDIGNFTTHKVNKMILPCWSLAALLKYLSEIKSQVYTHILFQSEGKWILQFVEYGHGNVCEVSCDNPIDACVAMIEKLNELKRL